MRGVIWVLILAIVAVVAAATFGTNDGVVSLYWRQWRVDLSLNLFLLLLIGLVALTYTLVGAVSSLIGLPERARLWRTQRRERGAQAALREAIGLLFAGRYSRAKRAAERALDIQAAAPELLEDAEFRALAGLISASSLHRLQDRVGRDQKLAEVETLLARSPNLSPVREGASLLAAEWALDDRDPERALDRLSRLPAGVARRTHALRLKLQADRLAREPLEALHTARLLAKHQGFTPAAAQGLLRSLANEALDGARDADQLRRVWTQFEAADRRDPVVAAHAAQRAVSLDAHGDARAWLRPYWDDLSSLGEAEREAVLTAFVDALPGLPDEWLVPLETAIESLPTDPIVAFAVGSALAERELWGRARRLLEAAGRAPHAPVDLRRRAWRSLARMAERDGDEATMQRCFREAALAH